MGRPDPAGGEDRPERIECIDDRSLLVANHPHFLEIDADRRQIFRDIADVLVLGAAGQDLATDHQERGRDGLFGSGRICGCHDHLQENAPNDGPTQDGETRELVVRPYTAIVGYAASSHHRGKLEKRFCATTCNTQASRGGLTPHQPAIPRQGGYLRTEDAAGRQQKGFPMITRRNCLIGASAALIGAPAIVRAGNVMAIRGVPVQRAYYGFCDRLRIDCLYRSGKLRGGALIHAADEGLLRHTPQAKLDYDIGRWSTLEV